MLFLAAGCSTRLVWKNENDAADNVAEVYTKAASYVYSQDFAVYPVEKWFTREELRVLRQHLPATESMVTEALGLQDSVGGARLALYFGITNAVPLLRSHLLNPRPCYGWEGPDYSDPENYLTDNQYPYSIEYLDAMESLTGKPMSETMNLRSHEAEGIRAWTKDPGSEFYNWAIWMQRKLGMTMKPNQAPEDTARKLADPQH